MPKHLLRLQACGGFLDLIGICLFDEDILLIMQIQILFMAQSDSDEFLEQIRRIFTVPVVW